MNHSKFMTAMCDEVRRQGGEHIYYSVVTLEQPAEGEGLYHMEKVDFQPGNPGHDCYSTAKAITSIAVGILYDRGLLKPTDKLGKYLSSYMIEGTDPKWGDLTLHQVMRHRTGAEYGIDFDNTNAHLWKDPEWLHTLFAVPIVGEPEERFVYSDGSYYIIGRVVEEITGMDLELFMQREVFVPLGCHVNAWSRDVNGHTVGGTGLYFRTEDLAKIGWLWANEGMWGDRRIYSKEWSDLFVNYQKDGVADYGYGICRITDGVIAGGGMYGQGVCADLNRKRVVAFHCFDPHGKTSGLNGFCAGLKD